MTASASPTTTSFTIPCVQNDEHPQNLKRGALWSDEEDAHLLALLKSSTSIFDISQQLSRDLYNQYRSTDPAFQSAERFYHPHS